MTFRSITLPTRRKGQRPPNGPPAHAPIVRVGSRHTGRAVSISPGAGSLRNAEDRALGRPWTAGHGIMVAVNPFEELICALEDAGLWSDIAEERKRAVMRALLSGEDVRWTAGGAWRADGEDLAEGEVEAWLGGMVAALNDCGVELRLATVTGPFDEGSTGYAVAVNGTPLYLYRYVLDGAQDGDLPAVRRCSW